MISDAGGDFSRAWTLDSFDRIELRQDRRTRAGGGAQMTSTRSPETIGISFSAALVERSVKRQFCLTPLLDMIDRGVVGSQVYQLPHLKSIRK